MGSPSEIHSGSTEEVSYIIARPTDVTLVRICPRHRAREQGCRRDGHSPHVTQGLVQTVIEQHKNKQGVPNPAQESAPESSRLPGRGTNMN